ncbi:MAG: ester cyclase, partial [Ktedonobacteraceae bacterium]|nr:ester cyclase [Ktedonobacteraceae bacterium]
MTTEANKSIVLRYLELYATGDLSIADEILAPDFVDHTHPDRAPGPQVVKDEVAAFRTAFPDAYSTVERMIAEDDTVAFRFTVRGTHQNT